MVMNWTFTLPYVIGAGSGWVACMVAVAVYNIRRG